MQALFDADILVFRCGFAAERAKWFLNILTGPNAGKREQFDYKREADIALDELLPGRESRKEVEDYELWSERFVEPVEHALHNVKTVVERAQSCLHLTDWDTTMFLSGPDNYRYDVAVTRPYKGNRDTKHRPTHEEAIKDYIKSKWATVISEGEEADDALGIHQTSIGPNESVIISQDKDLDMIPGLKYDFVEDETYSVTEEQAMHNFYMQLLMGDTTDNIPGLPKIGKAKAKKALEGVEVEDQMGVVMQMYERHAPQADWYEYLREQGKLLWIRRVAGEIWEPPSIEAAGLEVPEVSMY